MNCLWPTLSTKVWYDCLFLGYNISRHRPKICLVPFKANHISIWHRQAASTTAALPLPLLGIWCWQVETPNTGMCDMLTGGEMEGWSKILLYWNGSGNTISQVRIRLPYVKWWKTTENGIRINENCGRLKLVKIYYFFFNTNPAWPEMFSSLLIFAFWLLSGTIYYFWLFDKV